MPLEGCPHSRENKILLKGMCSFSFCCFPGEKHLGGQDCGQGLGAKICRSVWFWCGSAVPCRLEALAKNVCFEPSLVPSRFKDCPFPSGDMRRPCLCPVVQRQVKHAKVFCVFSSYFFFRGRVRMLLYLEGVSGGSTKVMKCQSRQSLVIF